MNTVPAQWDRSLVAISPPRLSHSRFAAGLESDQFLKEFAEAERQVACPMLFTFGTIELRRGSAFQGLPEDLNTLAEQGADLKVAVIGGADHFYTAARPELAGQIQSWLANGAMEPPLRASL